MKYLGSKRRLKKHLLPLIEAHKGARVYVEPFAGGMNLIEHVSGERIANDVNPYLVAMFDAVVNRDYILPDNVSKEHFEFVKNNKEKFLDEYVGAVGFCYGFGGKFFGSYVEEKTFEKSSKKFRWRAEESRQSIYAQKDHLKGVKFTSKSYDEILYPANSVIYCDPPYFGTYDYSVKFDHQKFWTWVKIMSKNHDILVSEYFAPPEFLEICNFGVLSGSKFESGKAEKLFTFI